MNFLNNQAYSPPTLRAALMKSPYAVHNTGGHGRVPTVFWGSRDCQGQVEFFLNEHSAKALYPSWVTGADPLA